MFVLEEKKPEEKKMEEKKPEEVKKPEEEKKEEKPAEEKKEEKKAEEGKDGKEAKEGDAPPPPPPPQEIVLRVYMHCEGCARKVKRCLKGFQGLYFFYCSSTFFQICHVCVMCLFQCVYEN